MTRQQQYFDVMSTWGTWAEFQALLGVLSTVAQKLSGETDSDNDSGSSPVSISHVAARWVLQQRAVGAVIVGTRLGVSSSSSSSRGARDNLRVFDFELRGEDLAAINAAALGGGGEKADAVYRQLGDCGSEYRAMVH